MQFKFWTQFSQFRSLSESLQAQRLPATYPRHWWASESSDITQSDYVCSPPDNLLADLHCMCIVWSIKRKTGDKVFRKTFCPRLIQSLKKKTFHHSSFFSRRCKSVYFWDGKRGVAKKKTLSLFQSYMYMLDTNLQLKRQRAKAWNSYLVMSVKYEWPCLPKL